MTFGNDLTATFPKNLRTSAENLLTNIRGDK